MTSEQAHVAIAAVDGAALMLAQAIALEMQLADERALVKDAAIRRLVDAKTYGSVTAAEKFVEHDPEFLAHRVRERESVAARIVAQGKFEAAKLRAQLAVEQWTASPDDDRDGRADDFERLEAANDRFATLLDRIDAMLDRAGIVEKDDAGAFLGIDKRVQILIDQMFARESA